MTVRSTFIYTFYAFLTLCMFNYGLPNVDLKSTEAPCTTIDVSHPEKLDDQNVTPLNGPVYTYGAQQYLPDSEIPHTELETTSANNAEQERLDPGMKFSLLNASPEYRETIMSNPLEALEVKLEELRIEQQSDRQKSMKARLIRKLAWSEYGDSKHSERDSFELRSQTRRSDAIDAEVLQNQIRTERIEADIRMLRNGEPVIKEEIEYWLFSA